MRFSVVTSYHVWNEFKEKQLKRCINSVLNQSYGDFEHILVNDGSPREVEFPNDDRLVHLEIPHHERIIALSHGLAKAQGEWIVFLDSDDEFVSYGLECMDQMATRFKKYKVINYGSIHIGRDYFTHIRGAFQPKKEEVGHEIFGGGNIVNGTFVFRRECYLELGGFPPTAKIEDPSGHRDFLYMSNPWDFSVAAQLEFPEIMPHFRVIHPNHPKGIPRELGNPWGNDFYYFYKLTRKYHSKPFNIPLLIVHHEGRTSGEGHKVVKTH